jgi:two-component system invasion response regulator UvrY
VTAEFIKVVIVDDHELIREALSFLLQNEPSIEVVGIGASGEDAVNLANELRPDIVILDLHMPGLGGIEAARKILRLPENVKIIILSSFKQTPFPTRLLEIGVLGYLHKGTSQSELVRAIETVQSGHVYLDPEIARALTLEQFGHQDISPFSNLTERELQVFLMLIHAVPVEKIADYLCLSTKTVCGYRYALFDKLHIHTDVELTHLAYQHEFLLEATAD